MALAHVLTVIVILGMQCANIGVKAMKVEEHPDWINCLATDCTFL